MRAPAASNDKATQLWTWADPQLIHLCQLANPRHWEIVPQLAQASNRLIEHFSYLGA